EKKMTKVPRIMLFGVETGWTFQCHSGLHTTGTAPRAGWLSTCSSEQARIGQMADESIVVRF
ncbi:MAG: hypothetical protein M3490_09505, partial [Chloroflexota bacterium]|nr:hypothetical protein [Chloroflexota bacterium]